MAKIIIGWNEYCTSSINNQYHIRGTSHSEVNAKRSYFITQVAGTNVTIKDGAGNTVLQSNSQSFIPAVRVDGGLQITSPQESTVFLFWVDLP